MPANDWFGFVTNTKAKEMIRWMIEKKLRWTPNEVREKLVPETFAEHAIGDILKYNYDGDMFGALDTVYPGMYKQRELQYYKERRRKAQVA